MPKLIWTMDPNSSNDSNSSKANSSDKGNDDSKKKNLISLQEDGDD